MKPLNQFQVGLTIFLLIFLPFSYSSAQTKLFLNFQSIASDFPSLEEQDIRLSNQFFLQITNPISPNENIYRLELVIQGQGITMSSKGKPGNNITFKGTNQISLFSSDLAHYFDIEQMEMSGISADQYYSQGLPEGIYTLCFTVMDITYDRYLPVSNQACVNLWVRENLPPQIIRPLDNELLSNNDQYLFQWMPKHISTTPVSYNLFVFESIEGIAPHELLSGFRPVIEEKTFSLQYILMGSDSRLKDGKNYIAFVQAEPLSHNLNFANGGYSAPVEFEIEREIGNPSRMIVEEIPESDCTYPASDVIINEFNFGIEGGRGTFIELLVTGTQSSLSSYDLQGWILDDNNYFQANQYAHTGHIRLGSCFSDIPRGSIILIYDSNYLPTGINPAMDGLPNANGVYQISLSNSCLSVTTDCPAASNTHYACNGQSASAQTWPNQAKFDLSSDLIQLRNPNGDLEHAILWNTDDFEVFPSNKVIYFNPVTMTNNTGFAFTAGVNWYSDAAYTIVTSAGQATPGASNSTANGNLIDALENLTQYNPFHILCHHEVIGNSHWAIIDIFGKTPNSSFQVKLDGDTVIHYSLNNPIRIQVDGIGFHILSVKDLSTECTDEDIIEVPANCIPGTKCNDLNSCTSGDVLDANCNCAGVQDDEVNFTVDLNQNNNCDYCMWLDPEHYNPLLDYIIFESITIELPSGGTVYLNKYDNFDDDRNVIFHFPYCFGCSGGDDLALFMNDLNAWLVSNGYTGSVGIGDGACGPNSLIFLNTNLTILFGEAETNIGDPITINFTESNCSDLPVAFGYNITAGLEICGENSAENPEDEVNWLWSNGAVTPFIVTPSQENCYSVTVTCSDGCSYVGSFPETGDCECTVGSPCIVAGTMPLDCRTGVFNAQCECIVGPYPDSDNDGVCDIVDICPGFNDKEDTDHDGIPDGCDTTYPCNEIVGIDVVELGQANCDYCLPVEATTTFPNDPKKYFKSMSFVKNQQPLQFDLLNDWQILNSENFELNWGIWNSGGSYVDRWNDPEYAQDGKYAVRLFVNNSNSNMYSNTLDLATSCQVRLDFSFIAVAFNTTSDGFVLEMSTNNGSSYSPVETFLYSNQFVNDVRYNKSIYINGSFSHLVKFRFKTLGSNSNQRIYLDALQLRVLTQNGYGCLSTDDDRSAFALVVDDWLYQHANLDFTYLSTGSGVCGVGNVFQVLNSELAFKSIAVIGDGYLSNYQFTSPDCEQLLPGEYNYILEANSSCLESTYEWSTGQTSSSIQVPNEDAGYQVTITCEDDCVYVVNHGNQNCVVGTPCSRPNDPCNPSGVINEFCECEVEAPNIIDLNDNGIPDCKEQPCACDEEPELVYTPVTIEMCDLCLNLTGVNDKLKNVTITIPGDTIQLNNSPFFTFPYCIGTGGTSGCNPDSVKSFDKFKSDFYKWSLDRNYQIRVLIEENNQDNCGTGNFLRIENAPFSTASLTIQNSQTPIASTSSCETVNAGFHVSLNTTNCAVCQDATFEWSDGSITNTPNAASVANENIGYTVTVTCNEYCSYVLTTPGTPICIVGTPCEDGYNDDCTENDVFNEFCICTGEIADQDDDDQDGVPNSCDKCEGFDDGVDDDADTVPNGCDVCPGQNDFDPNINMANCEGCSFAQEPPYLIPLYTSTITINSGAWCPANMFIGGFSFYLPEANLNPPVPAPIEIDLKDYYQYFQHGYCFCKQLCPSGAFLVDQFAIDLQNWLVEVMGDINAQVVLANDVLYIRHSYLRFNKLYIEQEPDLGDGLYYPFSRTQEETNIEIGKLCDDGNPCTIFDRWNEDCRCIGIYQDSDGDGICDAEDTLCPGELDYIDFDENGIPDCSESQTIPCGEEDITICEFYKRLLAALCPAPSINGDPPLADQIPVVINDDQISTYPAPRVLQKDIRDIQLRLIALYESTNWHPLNMNYPQLLEDLKMFNDKDIDGIVDYLDPCPDKAQTESYFIASDFDGCGCESKSWESMVVLYGLLFETVSFINVSNSTCYTGIGDPEIVQPGCALALGILVEEDENCVLRAVDGHCPIEFRVNCNGDCEAVYLGGHDGDNNCEEVTEIGAPCTLTLADCIPSNPCAEMTIEGNPAYPDDPNAPPCLCKERSDNDSDDDGVCDDDDYCPDIPFVDFDEDGIDDCIDNCPTIPGMRGDPCDDGDPCTYADVIDENCNCAGVAIDLDDDGVFDCEPCNAAHDIDGDGYIDEVAMVNGKPACDVCPGLDDTVDEDEDGRPDCIFPPYRPIGCPDNLIFVDQTGIVLVFDSEDISKDDLPEPISTFFYADVDGVGIVLFQYDYLTISNIRENAGLYEVLYTIEGLPSLGAPQQYYIPIVGVTYADHQQCVLRDEENDNDPDFVNGGENLIDLLCPVSFLMNSSQGRITLHFDIPSGFFIDPAGFTGDIQFNLSGSNGTVAPNTKPMSDAALSVLPSSLDIAFINLTNLGDPSTYSGSITLPNLVSCPIQSGALNGGCPDNHAVGDPCDDGDPCTHHDKWTIDCLCKGEESPNTDGDDLCDEVDPCPEIPNDPNGPDMDGDGLPDCPCEGLDIISFQLINGNDLEVTLDMTNALLFSHIDVIITGGPEDFVMPGLPFCDPFIISNLAYGYYYEIILKGVCNTGGIQEATLEIDIPFSEDQFVCGINIKDIDIASYSMLQSMERGDIFSAADFEIHVGSVSGSSGKFSGLGYIQVPYLNQVRINVSFTDVIISADYQLIVGEIKVNGFGLALLGDDLSNAINDLVNKVLDPLLELNEILEEINEMLELIDEYIATTSQFVSQEAKDCVTTAKDNLIALQQQQPPATEAELQAATVEVQNCMKLYNDELLLIMSSVSEVIEPLLEQIYLEECLTQLDDLRNAYKGSTNPLVEGVINEPLETYTDVYEDYIADHQLLLDEALQAAGFTTNEPKTFYYPITVEEIQSETYQLQQEFYTKESAYHFCYMMDIISNPTSNEFVNSPEEIKVLLKLLLEIGNELIDDIQILLKSGYTTEEIVNDPEKKIQLLLESYLRSSVQLRSYGNIR